MARREARAFAVNCAWTIVRLRSCLSSWTVLKAVLLADLESVLAWPGGQAAGGGVVLMTVRALDSAVASWSRRHGMHGLLQYGV